MHCFTGSQKFAENFLKLNAYFSASGIITFKNSIELQNTFKFLPLNRILIETDSPFLAPVPNRGKKNEPSFIDFTASKLAEIKGIEKSELIKITTDNFDNLFLIKNMKFIILGCGSSMGVPRPDGFFGNCDPKNKKNYRTRCSALLKTSNQNILFDTSPDLRQQLLRHKIKKIDKVLLFTYAW